MDNQAINEAIEILINNFTRHPRIAQDSAGLTVFDMLQEFWRLKASKTDPATANTSASAAAAAPTTAGNIAYEFLQKPGPPYICFVTLPGGACFATFQNCASKLEAKKNAALISLMNSVFNEHPLRRINEEFIAKSTENAQKDYPSICPLSLQLYKRLLLQCLNKTMLEFKQMMTIFQLLHWNGSLKIMRERNCSLEEVLEFYSNFVIDEKVRTEMSLDWIAREQQTPGTILAQLQQVNQEIEAARLNGQELRFLKEKRDILLLASYQFDMEINA